MMPKMKIEMYQIRAIKIINFYMNLILLFYEFHTIFTSTFVSQSIKKLIVIHTKNKES